MYILLVCIVRILLYLREYNSAGYYVLYIMYVLMYVSSMYVYAVCT